MNQELITQASTIINAIGTKISQGAIYAWPILVRQQVINGISDIFTAIVLLIISGALGYLIYKFIHKLDENNFNEFGLMATLGIMLGSLLIIGCMVAFLAYAQAAIRETLNPEYAAMKDVICTVKTCNNN